MRLTRGLTGTLWLHLARRGVVAKADVIENACTSSAPGGTLVHLHRDCPVAASTRRGPVTYRQVVSADMRDREDEFRRCSSCWAADPAFSPSPLQPYVTLASQLTFSYWVDALYAGNLTNRFSSPLLYTGLRRALALVADELTPITDPEHAAVAALVARQRQRLASWKPSLMDRVLGRCCRGTDTSWVLISRVPLPAAGGSKLDEREQLICTTIGTARHTEVLDGPGRDTVMLAQVSTAMTREVTRWHSICGSDFVTVTDRADEYPPAQVRASVLLDPDVSRESAGRLLEAVQAASGC